MEERKEMYQVMFLQLVISLESSAWMMLGKIANPLTGKIEKDLPGAKASIDTLMMLKEKTKGNLSEAEDKHLSNALTQLQLNYIEELKTKPAREKTDEKKPEKDAGKKKKKKKK